MRSCAAQGWRTSFIHPGVFGDPLRLRQPVDRPRSRVNSSNEGAEVRSAVNKCLLGEQRGMRSWRPAALRMLHPALQTGRADL
ncbi:hypothetical protein MHYP_G00193760 [Metynnis hypsauchen]